MAAARGVFGGERVSENKRRKVERIGREKLGKLTGKRKKQKQRSRIRGRLSEE